MSEQNIPMIKKSSINNNIIKDGEQFVYLISYPANTWTVAEENLIPRITTTNETGETVLTYPNVIFIFENMTSENESFPILGIPTIIKYNKCNIAVDGTITYETISTPKIVPIKLEMIENK